MAPANPGTNPPGRGEPQPRPPTRQSPRGHTQPPEPANANNPNVNHGRPETPIEDNAVNQAIARLTAEGFLDEEVRETDITLAKFATFLEQIAVSLSQINQARPAVTNLRAVAVLLNDRESVESIGDAIAARVMEKCAWAVEEAARINAEVLDGHREDIRSLYDEMKKVSKKIDQRPHPTSNNFNLTIPDPLDNDTVQPTYASITATQTRGPAAPIQAPTAQTRPPQLDNRHIMDRQVLLDWKQTEAGEVPSSKTEMEWTSAANRALSTLPHPEPTANPEAETIYLAVSTTKLRNGGIVLEFNTAETARFVQNNAADFAARLGTNWVVKRREWTVKAKFVPVSFNPDGPESPNAVCNWSNLDKGVIAGLRWQKNPEYRNAGQTTANLLVRFTSIEMANKAVKDGLYIMGKRSTCELPRPEPFRCNNCQQYGHIAAECKNTIACGYCAKAHRQHDCPSKSDPTKFQCTNCKSPNHTAWDRSCPEFTKRLTAMKTARQSSQYRYIVTEEPWTWQPIWTDRQPPPPTPFANGEGGFRDGGPGTRRGFTTTNRVHQGVTRGRSRGSRDSSRGRGRGNNAGNYGYGQGDAGWQTRTNHHRQGSLDSFRGFRPSSQHRSSQLGNEISQPSHD